MKCLGILGSINRDTIVLANGNSSQSLGGVLYTAMAAAYLSGGRYQTRILARLGVDIYPQVERLVSACSHLDTSGIQVFPGANPHCRICYGPDGGKVERLSGDLTGFSAEAVLPQLVDLDMLAINFITGFELTLPILRAIRQAFTGLIFMDVHSLTLGRRASGERFFRPLDNWRDWLQQADVVQLNEREAAWLYHGQNHAEPALAAFIRHVLALGCKGVVITRGALGCMAGDWHMEQPRIRRHPAVQAERVQDTTGCGDVFLAGLAAGYLLGADLSRAVGLASRAAAINCGLSGVSTLAQLVTIHH